MIGAGDRYRTRYRQRTAGDEGKTAAVYRDADHDDGLPRTDDDLHQRKPILKPGETASF